MTVLLAVLAVPVYFNSFTVPYFFDDRHNILGNPYIRMTETTPPALFYLTALLCYIQARLPATGRRSYELFVGGPSGPAQTAL